MFKRILSGIRRLISSGDGDINQEENPYAPPQISTPGKIICGLDLSTSIARRSHAMADAWEHQLLNRLQQRWPDLEMLLLGVNRKVWPLPPCENYCFKPLSQMTRYTALDFTKEKLLAGGSAFYDYLLEASKRAIELKQQQRRRGVYAPVMVCLLCDGEPRGSKSSSEDALEMIEKARKVGVQFRISCFVPDRHDIVKRMSTFRQSLKLNNADELAARRGLQSPAREEFFLITEDDDDPEQSVASCVEEISESILRIGYEDQQT